MKTPALLVLCVAVLAGCAKEPFKVADSAVVYADAYRETKVEPWGRMAAADLARILSLVTGSEVKAYSESEWQSSTSQPRNLATSQPRNLATSQPRNIIYVGPVKAAEGLEVGKPGVFAFRVKVEPERVFLLGRNETGSSYAVTEFLERFCGYRFLSQDGENPYAVNPALAIAPADLSLAPAIPYRRVYRGWIKSWVQGNDLPKTAANWRNFARQRRLETRVADQEPSHRVHEVNHSTCHLAFTFLPPDKYAKAHPEWYSMDENGSRNSIPNGGGQLCYSNGAMREEYAKNLLAMIAADRAADSAGAPRVYDCTQLDNTSRLCLCPECRKVIAKYDRKPGGHRDGGDAGLQLEFANDIAARVAAKYPDVKVRIFAYVSTEAVPEGIEVHPNVVIWWCDVYTWSDHMRALRHPVNVRNCGELSGWLGKTKNFHLWDYMLYGTVPEVNAEAIRDDARLFRDLGVDDIFMESEYHDQPFYDLHQYLFDKLYFDPDDDPDRLIGEYCAVYGKGAAKMRELIGLLMKWEREGVPESMEKWHQRELPWYTVENFNRMRELAEAAYALEDGIVPRSRIAYVLAGIDKWLMEKSASVYGKEDETARLRADYVRYSKEWACRESEDPAKRKVLAKKLDDALLVDTLQFGQLPAELKGVSAADLKCIDWRSKKMGSGLKLVDDPASESGKSYCYRAAKMPDFPITGGVFDIKTKKVLARCQVERPPDLKEGEFFWTKLCPVTLGWNSYLWLTGSWKVQAHFKSFYVNCDGAAVDVNRYEVWVSLRFAGPKYFPGSKAEDAFYMDRVVLRRIK